MHTLWRVPVLRGSSHPAYCRPVGICYQVNDQPWLIYSGSYDDVVNQGQNEVQRGYEPEIKPLDINIADYDVIAVGTPTWWYTMAPAVKTFLHQQDFTGKTVVPFMTNGGWPGHVIKDMKAACKGANVVCDMQIQFDSTGGSNLETPQEQINEWIQSVKNLL